MNAQQCRERMILMQRDRIELIKQSPEYIDLMISIGDAIEMDPFCTQYPLPVTDSPVSLFCLTLKSEGFNFEYTMTEGNPKGFISWELPKVEYTIGSNEVLTDSDDRDNTVAEIVSRAKIRAGYSGWVAVGPRPEVEPPIVSEVPDLGAWEFFVDEDETSYTIGKTVSVAIGSGPMSTVGYRTTHRVVSKEVH